MSSENPLYGYVPVLSSQAGSCLTMANWEEAGVRAISLRLDDLLMKPGMDMLASLQGIHSYIAWRGLIILNASFLQANREGVFRFRSVYDGAWIRLDMSAMFRLVVQLNPDRLLLPPGSADWFQTIWKHLPESIVPYWHASDSLFASAGESGNSYLAKFWPDTRLVDGQIETEGESVYTQADIINPLMLKRYHFLETDSPARDGVVGRVYSSEGTISITESSMEQAHQLLDRDCQCPTCRQQFTRAYLHHLLQHTPLLAQRLLVQHNAGFVQQLINR